MFNRRYSLAFLILFFCPLRAGAQNTLEPEQLFSPSIGQKFYQVAYDIAESENISGPEVEQAITFLNATLDLDNRAKYVHPVLIKLVLQNPGKNYSEIVYNSLTQYLLDAPTDFEPARQAIQYLLERLDSREQREQLLTILLKNLSGKNASLDSELATQLGLLMAEKTDPNAIKYFLQAFNSNKYNKLAFEKLVELLPKQIAPAVHLEHLRLVLGENPLDLKAALAFAAYAQQIQLYDIAADAYEYCTQLFNYLYPSQDLPPYIYLPWMLCSYNTERNQHNCLKIASQLQQSGRFDLLAEAIAAKAVAKIGNTKQANQIFRDAEEKINNQSSTINTHSIAWFYCFALPDANNALDWANKAYSSDPNSSNAAALLAYSLVMNKQNDWAKLLIDEYDNSQIADLTLAQIQLADGQKDAAIETLKSVIDKAPASIEAEHAKDILRRNGGEYIPPADPDLTLMALRNTFAQTLVPAFTNPEKIISVQLNVRGNEFSYGSTLNGTIAITNNSSEPLVISDDALFKGNIRIDADITGDLNKNIPNFLSLKIRSASPLAPGSSFFIPLHLFTGELKKMLFAHPQASLEIKFTLYLDPVTKPNGRITSRIPNLKPAVVSIKRPGIKLTGRYLRNRFSSLTNGRQGQKIKAAYLFIGLLIEQHAMANREPPYKFVYADWMPATLKSALVHSLEYDNWEVKGHTMGDMTYLPLDFEFINSLSENLNDTHWPTRLMALYLLAKNQNKSFNKVLDWAAKYDSNEFVRDMAVALGGTPPPLVEEPEIEDQPAQDAPQQQLSQQPSPLRRF